MNIFCLRRSYRFLIRDGTVLWDVMSGCSIAYGKKTKRYVFVVILCGVLMLVKACIFAYYGAPARQAVPFSPTVATHVCQAKF